jgi:LmeA-like phospholipid-binding
MELITVVLSGLLLLISPVGIVVDQVAEDAIRSRIVGAESLEVRVDNGPSFQLLQGRVNKVRIAGRGLELTPGLRLEVADLETDPVDLAFTPLRKGEVVLDQPLQGALHVVMSEADVNTFLRSPTVIQRLSELKIGSLNQAQARERDRYKINNPTIDFLAENRLKISLDLEDLVQPGSLRIEAESGLSVSAGDRLMLVDPVLTVNGQPAPTRLVTTLLGDVNERLSLQRLEDRGLTARVINLAVQPEALDLALWIRVDPSVTAPPVAAANTSTSALE